MTVLRLSCGIACSPVGRLAEQRVDVGRHRGVGQRDHVAVLQRRRAAVAGQQRDVLLADRRLAVHLGFEIRRDLDVRVQRQHRLHAGVGQGHGFHPADLGAAVGDVAAGIEPAGLRQLARSPCSWPTPNIGPAASCNRSAMNASATSAITAKIASWILIRLVRCMSWPLIPAVRSDQRIARRCSGRSRCTGWGTGRWCGPTAAPARSGRPPTGCR